MPLESFCASTGGQFPVAAVNAGGGRYFAGSGIREDLRQAAWGQVCIASRGKVKKLCMEVKAGTSADGYIRALRGSGGL